MPLKTIQYELSNWQGFNRYDPEADTDPHFWSEVQNVEFDQGGVLAKRRGTTTVSLTFGSAINLIYDWQNQLGFNSLTDRQRTVVIAGAAGYVIEGFNSSNTISYTFGTTDEFHNACTDDNGICFIAGETSAVPKMLCCIGGNYYFQDITLTAPGTITIGTTGSTSYSGTFYAVASYVDAWGNESPLSPESDAVVVSNNGIQVGVTEPADPTVSYIKVYLLGPKMSEYQLAGTMSTTGGTFSYTGSLAELGASDFPPEYLEDAPEGRVVTIYEDMLLIAGDKRRPDVVWASNRGFHRQWSDNYAKCVSGDGQEVRAFGDSFDRKMVLKADSVFVCEGEHQDNFNARLYDGKTGVVGQRAVTLGPGRMVWFADEGAFVDTGSNPPQEISTVIREHLRTLNYQNIVVPPAKMFLANYKYYKQIFFACREDGSAGENDTILVWSYERNTWTRYNGCAPRVMALVQNKDDYEYLFGGDSQGNLWIFNPPNAPGRNDDMKFGVTFSVTSYAVTPWMNFPKLLQSPEWERTRTIPRYLKIYASGEPASALDDEFSLQATYYTDFNHDTVRGTFNVTFKAHAWPTIRPYSKTILYGGSVGTYNWIKWRFDNAEMGQHYRIHKLVFGSKLKPAID
jgi:hypothetical protein